MTEQTRGIECILSNDKLDGLLHFLSEKDFDFYVQWCMKIDNIFTSLPQPSYNFFISPNNLNNLAKESIWELVLHVYPVGSNKQIIDTYNDFINSSCICCIIFYDCSLLDIYVKETGLRNQLYNLLCSLQAKDIAFITDSSDTRAWLSLRGQGDGSVS